MNQYIDKLIIVASTQKKNILDFLDFLFFQEIKEKRNERKISFIYSSLELK